ELLVSSLYVSPFQVSWAVSRSLGGGVTGLTPDPLRRLAWAERLVNGDFGLQLVDGDGSRLAVGSLNAKEPQLDLLLALPGDLQAQLPSGALLALDARALRLGLRQGNDLHFGPPLDGGLFALSAKIQGLHTEAILVTDAALQLVADYSCQLPPAEYYDISNCSGRRTASSCSLQCREAAVPQPGFARPVVKCPSEGGVFSLEGCSAPSCFLPEVPEEFDLQCGASNGPFRAEDCQVQCRSGQVGALALCQQHLSVLELSGCPEAKCLLPADTAGYDVSGCDTGRAVPAYQCLVTCAEGFAPPPGQNVEVSCDEGKTEFRLTGCFQQCVAPEGIAYGGQPSCARPVLPHTDICQAQCAAGYQPSPSELRCERGLLVPAVFECKEANCQAPAVLNATEPSCQEGALLLSGTSCTPSCAQGYRATALELLCLKGQLDPPSFRCEGLPCSAPSSATEEYASPACAEGEEIPHGGLCTARCAPGSSPMPLQLQCAVQQLQPPNFTCGKACDAPTGIPNAQEPTCAEGAVLEHGTFCSPVCGEGFSPLVALDADLQKAMPQLNCWDGAMRPPRFTCAPGVCPAPQGVQDSATPACAEGWNIGSGGQCTSLCQPGFSGTPVALSCNASVFTPGTFSCAPQNCEAPGVVNAETPSCSEGQVIRHGESCTPRCAMGFSASESRLSCRLGTLLPPSFSCSQAALGTEAWTVAAATTEGGAALCAFSGPGGVLVHSVQEQNGVAISAGSQRVALELPALSWFLVAGLNALLVYLRPSTCGTWELALHSVEPGSAPQVSEPATRPSTEGATVTAGAFLQSRTALVLAGREAFLVQPSSPPSISASATFTEGDVAAVAVGAMNGQALIAYVASGCLRSRLVSESLSFSEEQPVHDSEDCTSATSVAVSAFGSGYFLAFGAHSGRLMQGQEDVPMEELRAQDEKELPMPRNCPMELDEAFKIQTRLNATTIAQEEAKKADQEDARCFLKEEGLPFPQTGPEWRLVYRAMGKDVADSKEQMILRAVCDEGISVPVESLQQFPEVYKALMDRIGGPGALAEVKAILQLVLDEPPEGLYNRWVKERLEYYRRVEPSAPTRRLLRSSA
ncbi:unnamed protein product, partial [Effrenium voratum]